MEQLHFDSASHGPEAAFDAYRDLYSTGSTVEPHGAGFHGAIRGLRFPRMLIFDRTLRAVSHERTRRRVAADGFDHLVLQLVIEGRMMSLADGAARVVEPGEIVVFDLTRPQRTWIERARIATVPVARDVVGKAWPAIADLHGTVLPRPGSDLLAEFIRALLRTGEGLEPAVAAVASATVGALLSAGLGANPGSTASGSLLETAKLSQCLDFIDANLARPDLGVDLVAREMAVSRSTLYRLFEPLGGVAARVQQRRVTALSRLLARPGEERPFGALAAGTGFASVSHAARSFRQVYGQTPGAFREAAYARAAAPAGAAGADKAVFASWFSEVR